jgi:predicted RNase H-like HicB family nuclease
MASGKPGAVQNGVFGISFPDFPGCVSTGTSADDVMRKGAQVLGFHVAGMVEDGDPLPKLRDFQALQQSLKSDSAAEGAVLALVAYDLPGRSVRVNVSIEESLLQAIDRAAETAGQSRSAFIAEAARDRLHSAA